jgi:hypothetical protein
VRVEGVQPGYLWPAYISILVWLFVVCVYISKRYPFFIDFHVLAFPGFSRAHHDIRLEKSVPKAPISNSVITIRCRLLMVNVVFAGKQQLDQLFFEIIPPCTSTSTEIPPP